VLIIVFIVAIAISMALIPPLLRIAPHIGMIDQPDPRKVHLQPVPRAGGIGIVIGALVPMMIWLPLTDTLLAYYGGSLVLLVFGMWDDIAELGHYAKFIGQFLSAILVVYYGGLVVESFPFLGLEPLPPEVGEPFTVVAIVGMINAINHSDGLDGLAGGESIMSLGGMLYLASQSESLEFMLVTVAVMGGIFGFLRFNSHPARVFMGDGGSQFIGFSLAVLAIWLTQWVNPALSPALPLLLLGLPIADILVVFWKRASSGRNWFRATKNHIHHRLMELGCHHYESVIVIYTVQAGLVVSGVLVRYSYDGLILALYLGVCGFLFALLSTAERRGWRAHAAGEPGAIARFLASTGGQPAWRRLPLQLVSAGVGFYLIASAFATTRVPTEFALVAFLLSVALAVRLVLGYRVWFLMLRLLVYLSVALLVYLVTTEPPSWMTPPMDYVFFGMMAALIVAAVRTAEADRFQMTPLDYLVVLIALALAVVPEEEIAATGAVSMAIKVILLFYGSELALRHLRSRWTPFTVTVLASLLVTGARGLAG
jgi:UDP-GlcNAc:undecaprenyl-phosphate GlcNAc-1-phosphate transferase